MKHRKGIYLKTAPQEEKDEDSISDEKSKDTRSKTSEVWLPETNTAFRILMSANLCSALLSNVSDCDETYNYWEPLHHMITGQGFQTWEYSPTYAIRSWAYIYLHYILTWFHFGFLDNRLLVFHYIRMILGVVCTLCEVHFYKGVSLRFGNNVARLVLGFLLFGTGMFISATAFLPSTFCMYMTFLFFGSWMNGDLHHAVLTVAAGSIVAWPFFAALGIPLAVDIVIRRRKYFFFIKWSAVALLTMQLPCIIIDSYFYGKSVCASVNILLYNVFTSHGPDLYGTEPFSYYIINGFLNFNIAFILALLSIVVIPLAEFIIKFKFPGYQPPTLLTGFSLSTLFIWFLIFFTRPHKEERFLFPVYPLICLAAALCIATVQKLYCVFGLHKKLTEQWMTAVALVTFALLSISRSYAVFQGYHGSVDIYPKMHQIAKQMDTSGKTITVCVGKEWHRFPSSFFLPDDFKLELIESEFRAQLPQHFAAPGVEGTRAVRTNFNDQNLEEKDRYVDIKSCHFLIDFNNGLATKREPLYGNLTKQWSVVEEVDYLSAHNSTNRIFRAFYVPYFFWERNTFGKYQLLRSKTKKFKKKRSP